MMNGCGVVGCFKILFHLCSMRYLIICLLLSSVCNAQLVLTDEFDFWEDQSSHNYSVSGITFQGAYVCSGDNSLRVSNCSVGFGSVTIDVAVNPLCDTIQLDFLVAWGGITSVYADAMNVGLIPDTTNCMYTSILIPNASSISADGFVTLNVTDTILGCTGDIQLSRVKVYSNPGFTTGTSAYNKFERSVVFPNPSAGLFYLASPDMSTLKNLTVINSSGQIVFAEEKYPASSQINLMNEPDGIYFIRLRTEQRVFTQKIILRK